MRTRIIFLTSLGFKLAPTGGIIFKDLKTTQKALGFGGRWLRNGQSKLANVLYAAEPAKRYLSLTVAAVLYDWTAAQLAARQRRVASIGISGVTTLL